jgi:chromosomal replication initiator protein
MTISKSAVPPPAKQQPQSPAELWTAALGQLQLQMTQATFDSWVKDTHLITANNGTWQIGVKSEFAKDWLENRLLTTIQRTVANLVGHKVET